MKKDRNQMSAKAGCLFAAALSFSLLAAGMSQAVSAESFATGSLTVQLEEFPPPSDWEGVSIALSKVGTADAYGEPEFYEEYGIESYPINSRETEEAIEKLLAAGALAGAPIYEVTDAGGAARFAGLSDGIYLGAAQESSRYGEISPFLIHTPYYNGAENGEPSGPSYDVAVHPKALPIEMITPTPEPTTTPTPEPTATPTPELTVTPTATPTPEATITPTDEPGTTVTPTPGETEEPESPDKPGGGSPNGGESIGGGSTSGGGTGNPPKTGDDTPIGLLLGLLCVSGLVIGIGSRRKKV